MKDRWDISDQTTGLPNNRNRKKNRSSLELHTYSNEGVPKKKIVPQTHKEAKQ